MRMLGGRARPDGEGGWTVDAEWSIAGRIYSREQIEAVDEVRAAGGESVKADGTMVICYPSAEDTLWRDTVRRCGTLWHGTKCRVR